MNVEVTALHEEFAARLGTAATNQDAAQVDSILAEVGDVGLDCALATLAVAIRYLVTMMTLEHGREAALKVFETTALQAGMACDD